MDTISVWGDEVLKIYMGADTGGLLQVQGQRGPE